MMDEKDGPISILLQRRKEIVSADPAALRNQEAFIIYGTLT
jgi:hypothetical protein